MDSVVEEFLCGRTGDCHYLYVEGTPMGHPSRPEASLSIRLIDAEAIHKRPGMERFQEVLNWGLKSISRWRCDSTVGKDAGGGVGDLV